MTINEHLHTIFERIHGTRLTKVFTGFSSLDTITGGFQQKQLYLLCSREEVAITALMSYWINFVLRQDFFSKVVTFSIRLSGELLTERLISQLSRVPLLKITEGILTDEEWNQIHDKGIIELKTKLLYIDDSGFIDIDRIEERIIFLHNTNNADIIFIDNLQLIANTSMRTTVKEHLDYLLNRLKKLAVIEEIPIVVLARFKKEEECKNIIPSLTELLENDLVEKHADAIMTLWVPDCFTKEKMQLSVLKNNKGSLGEIGLIFETGTQNFKEEQT